MLSIGTDITPSKKGFRLFSWFHLIFWPLFAVFMVTQLGGMQYQLRWWGELMREGTQTIGIILDVQDANTKSGQVVTIGFLSAEDKESKYRVESNVRFDSTLTSYKKGQLIVVKYDPSKPWHTVIDPRFLELDEEKWEFFDGEGLADPGLGLINPEYADVLTMNMEDYENVDQFDFSDLNIFL